MIYFRLQHNLLPVFILSVFSYLLAIEYLIILGHASFQDTGLLRIPGIAKSRMGRRAFSYQAPLLCNYLPVLVRKADTHSDFKNRLLIKSVVRAGLSSP